MECLPAPLYHGTSTLFLSGIADSGLGGNNPIAELKVLDFARALIPLVDEHLSKDEKWMIRAQSFRFMGQQLNASMNFQHGDTYLSISSETSIRYAVNKKYGSELLTYSIEFLQELLNRGIKGLADNMYYQFPQIFRFLDISCAPILIEAKRVPESALVAENGGDAKHNIDIIRALLNGEKKMTSRQLSQLNFRLTTPIPLADLTFWLIDVHEWNSFKP